MKARSHVDFFPEPDGSTGLYPQTALPMFQSDLNYCGTCSPFGFPFGDRGELCSKCGSPMEISHEEVSRTRAIRNRISVARQRGDG